MGCCGQPDEAVTGSSDHSGVAAWEGGAVAAVGTVDVKRHGGAWIVSLRGEHDLSTQPMLTERLRGLVRTGDGLVVDLTHVEFIDSTVIGALLGAYEEAGGAQAHRFAILVPRNGAVANRVVSLVGLDRVIPTVGHLETAIRSVMEVPLQEVDDGKERSRSRA
jgi:anti-sigma B factor antagonist